MRVVKIPVQTYQQPIETKKSRKRHFWLLVIPMAGLVVQLLRPLPAPELTLTIPLEIPSEQTVLALPSYGQSAIAAKGYGILETKGEQTQLSTASIAKVITALCVLERKPLKLGEKGPLITMTRSDTRYYHDEIEHNGSRVQVYEGMKMSEYQAIQALMIPSANNIANTLAIWAFGSLDAYREYANNYVMRQGLVNTRIGPDASGYDPGTVSSASDLVRLGLLAESNPVLIEIAKQSEAIFPMEGRLTNYNSILGKNGIDGLKTGNNDQNPGAFLMTGSFLVGSKKIQYSGAVMGADSLPVALASSNTLAASLQPHFENRAIVTTGAKVGTYETAWGVSGDLVAKQKAELVRWKGDTVKVELQKLEKATDRTYPTHLTIVSRGQTLSVPVRATQEAAGPSIAWRLTRL